MSDASSQQPQIEAEVLTPLPDDTFILRKLRGTETLSRSFEFHLEVLSDSLDLDFTQLVGQAISVKIKPGGEEARLFNGVVLRAGQKGTEERYAVYEFVMVPWFRLLELRSECKIYTEVTTAEVVRDVLGNHSWTFELEDISTNRDCCVRYRETDKGFVSRLLVEEGYYYYVKPDGDDHVLVIKAGDAPVGEHSEAHYYSEGQGHAEAEQVTEFRRIQEVVSESYEMVDFLYGDPTIGEPQETARSTVEQGSGGGGLSVFDFPELYGKHGTGASSHVADWISVRAQSEDARAIRYLGKSNVWSLLAGHGLRLVNHFRDDYNADYLLTEVKHELTFSGALEAGTFEESSYHNEFVCIPDGVAFRSADVEPKPRIYGVQSAIVQEAIDDQARVRVEFPWAKEQPSWWIRVSQAWAGGGWGHQYHPRVGHEVLVTFLNGDPDLPVIVGRVYNGANEGPYSAKHSQGGVKTRSMDGESDNYNEIRFEDEKGSEEILVHAEKQLSVEVEADESREVGGSRSEKVEKDVGITIGGDRSETVEGKRGLAVTGNKEESVGGAKSVSVSGAHTETIDDKMTLDVGKDCTVNIGKNLSESATDNVTVSSGKDMTHSAGKNATVSVGDDFTVSVGKGAKLQIEKEYGVEAKEIQIEAKDKIVLKSGKASITLKKNGDIVIDGKKLELKGSGDVKIKGSKSAVQ